MFASASVTPCSSAHRVASHAGETDDRVEHDVRLARLEQRRGRPADLHVLDAVRRRQVGERLRARHQRAELEVGVLLDDLDRLPADRAGGAEQGDAFHACRVPDARRVT